MKSRLGLALILVGGLFAGNAICATNDIYPGDYFPSEPGDRILSLYAYDRTSVGPYASGSKLDSGEVSGNIAAVRGVNTFELGGLTATSVVALTWADLQAKPITLANAIGGNSTGLATCAWG